jgi:hypothetical protein
MRRRSDPSLTEGRSTAMKKSMKLAAVGLGGVLVVLSQSATLNVKPGEWQMHMTSVMMGKPIDYKSCVKASDLNISTWTSGTRSKCTWKVLNATSTDMELQGSDCRMGNGPGVAQIHAKIHTTDAEDAHGTFDVTINAYGQTMSNHGQLTGKWIGPTCTRN